LTMMMVDYDWLRFIMVDHAHGWPSLTMWFIYSGGPCWLYLTIVYYGTTILQWWSCFVHHIATSDFFVTLWHQIFFVPWHHKVNFIKLWRRDFVCHIMALKYVFHSPTMVYVHHTVTSGNKHIYNELNTYNLCWMRRI